MAYSFINAVDGTGNAGSATTAAMNTTGADLLTVVIGGRIGDSLTLTDSKSNTWTALTGVSSTNDFGTARMYYCQGGTVGSGHTFTVSGATDICCVAAGAFSGSQASPFDVQNGAGGITGNFTLHTGSVTPSVNNELVVAACTLYNEVTSVTIDSGFTMAVNNFAVVTFTCSLAYLIETTATLKNPGFTTSSTARMQGAVIATFKAATAVATFTPHLTLLGVG